MNFSYQAYFDFIADLLKIGYVIKDFGHPDDFNALDQPFIILRHDIDVSIECAFRMATFEAENGISSSYFILMSSDFYNPNSASNRRMLSEIVNMGHKIGLHFDETVYEIDSNSDFNRFCTHEATTLGQIIGQSPIGVSFHRPLPSRLRSAQN